jgi:hypothetical protein
MHSNALGNVCVEIFHHTRPASVADIRGEPYRTHDVGEQ